MRASRWPWTLLLLLACSCAHRLPRPALEQGCREGLSNRCAELARTLQQQRDELAAVPFLARACELGSRESCVMHAAMYEWGRGVEQDRPHARTLYEAACAMGSGMSCLGRDHLDAQDRAARCEVPLEGGGGGLDRAEIKAVIDLHVDEIRYCYELVLTEDSAPELDVSLHWVINAGGAVTSTDLTKDTLPSSLVGECVRKQVLGWHFPCPRGGGVVNVTFPWLFRVGR